VNNGCKNKSKPKEEMNKVVNMLRILECPGWNLTAKLSSGRKKWSVCSEIMKPARQQKSILEFFILLEIKKM